MALPVYITFTSTNFVRYINLDATVAPFSVSAAVWTSTGTGAAAQVGLQYTLDDLVNTPSSNWRWFGDANIPVTTTLAPSSNFAVTNYIVPVTAIQAVVTSISCAASGNVVELKVIQGLPK